MAAFDYIVIGAGSAGAVVAGRLSEDPAVRVLLVEAGGSGRHLNVQPGSGSTASPGSASPMRRSSRGSRTATPTRPRLWWVRRLRTCSGRKGTGHDDRGQRGNGQQASGGDHRTAGPRRAGLGGNLPAQRRELL